MILKKLKKSYKIYFFLLFNFYEEIIYEVLIEYIVKFSN